MSVHPAVPGAPARPPQGDAGRTALRDRLDAAADLLGFTEPRADRGPSALIIRLGAPGETALLVTDRRGDETRSYRLDGEADDIDERLSAICGGAGVKAKVVVAPQACFMRTLVLPSAALARMRAVLAQELEAATPFRADSVHSDWYVEGEDVATRSLRVRHIVLKRARLDPLLATLRRAGIAADTVTVGPDEDRSMPVNLLCGGHRALPSLLNGGGAANLALLIASLLLLVGAFWGLRTHQEATLSALDDAFLATRRAAGPPVAAPVQAGSAAILAERGAPLAQVWDDVSAALPVSVSASRLHLDRTGVRLTLAGPDAESVRVALATVPGFGPAVLSEVADAPDGGRRIAVLLPRSPRQVRR